MEVINYFIYSFTLGLSESNITYRNKAINVKGFIQKDITAVMAIDEPFSGCKIKVFPTKLLENYNSLRIEAKTNTKLCITLGIYKTYFQRIQARGYLEDINRKDYDTYELPLKLFRDNDEGYIFPENDVLEDISLIVHGQDALKYEFEVKNILLTYNPEFEKLINQYRENFMFKLKGSYKDTQIDTGKKIFKLNKKLYF